ncbi:MAG: preprotein translocase subunit SecY [Candidatus Micrarchaeota archaeon]|nr:preprotein translocase subunit SecY [Candidatus Micrarchaeota archaeon]
MKLDFIRPVIHFLPEVKKPARPPNLNEKLMWVIAGLVIYFVMYHIFPIGVIVPKGGQTEFLQVIMASRIGSLITAGIGPIVLASIFLQLFIGAKIIDIDMSDPNDRKLFQGTQKMLALILCFFEAAIYIVSGSIQVYGMAGTGMVPLFGSILLTQMFVTIQLAFGSIMLLYLDEVISKYGIGSGISLFIAAGVSLSVFQGLLSLITGWGLADPSRSVLNQLSEGGADALSRAVLALLPFIFTVVVFLVVTYAEGMKVEIPLSLERARGFGGRYPIKFLYVSNIPVILASALLLNLQLWARIFIGRSLEILGVDIIPYIAVVGQDGRITDGVLYFLSPLYYNPISIGYDVYLSLLSAPTPFFNIPEYFHILTYTTFLVVLCVVFGKFWIETTGMAAKDVAAQLQKSGLQIPGFRRDPRVVEKILDKYIPTITLLGSAFVGLLAAFADLTGALGTGTGILLTVGILHKMYEDLNTQRMFDMYPQLKNIVGG